MNKSRYTIILIAYILFYHIACTADHKKENSHRGKQDLERSFCYWKTQLFIPKESAELLKRLKVGHLYMKYFDVDWSESSLMAVPKGILNINYNQQIEENGEKIWRSGTDIEQSVTPVIYITNRTFEYLNDTTTKELAKKVFDKLKTMHNSLADHISYTVDIENKNITDWQIADSLRKVKVKKWLSSSDEILIDCDWTNSTREPFFDFLKELKLLCKKEFRVSATIRLHQYRYQEKTGVPPVSRGLLMCYNIDELKNIDTKNSIFGYAGLAPYIDGVKAYPLELDIALPMFSWGVWFRGGEFKGLLNQWTEQHTKDNIHFKNTQENRYQVLVDTVIGDAYLREGDIIRIEAPLDKDMKPTIDLLKKHFTIQRRISFFDWDYEKVKEYETQIQTYFNQFR